MKVQQQNDGTFLAEQRDSFGRLQIAEAETQDEAWDSMIEMIGQMLFSQSEDPIRQAGMSAYGDR